MAAKRAAKTAPKKPSAPAKPKGLEAYHLLGRSGLRVSPLCLGTMTFGKEWGWGNSDKESEAIYRRYLDAGGNFVDTANFYTQGTSETLLGKFMKGAKNRDRVVLATKFTLGMHPGDPNGGGNGRKNIIESLEASLRRLQTDYVDLYWLHMYDGMTPVEEVMRTLDALVRSGKVRHIGFSDTPAWYLAKGQTYAELRGFEPLCALQLEYSLITRDIEREHVDAALEFGLGICPWSPLGGGLLSGKYERKPRKDGGYDYSGKGRLTHNRADHPRLISERNWAIIDALHAVARALGKSPAQVALNWATKRRGIASTIIGATSLAQLDDNLAALDFDIPAELAAKLDEVSKPTLGFPYEFLAPGGFVMTAVSGGTKQAAEPAWFRK
ncbi:MAG: aldo/keto reductase [Candidatus Sumerlaeia bacterium]|nr:aldo/keto reductase [Candidatus Sumerlaeia bacterium]